jgi:hypothetical protein
MTKRNRAKTKVTQEAAVVEPFARGHEAPPPVGDHPSEHRKPVLHAVDRNSSHDAHALGDRAVDDVVQLVTERIQTSEVEYSSTAPPAYSDRFATDLDSSQTHNSAI